jgi:hypothetical protein
VWVRALPDQARWRGAGIKLEIWFDEYDQVTHVLSVTLGPHRLQSIFQAWNPT